MKDEWKTARFAFCVVRLVVHPSKFILHPFPDGEAGTASVSLRNDFFPLMLSISNISETIDKKGGFRIMTPCQTPLRQNQPVFPTP